MSVAEPYRGPELIDFLEGYPGPADVPYLGGSISIVAALLYRDGIRLDWRIHAMPDLSRIDTEDEDLASSPRSAWTTPRQMDRSLAGRRVDDLWLQATLLDDRGTEYRIPGPGSGRLDDTGWEGRFSYLSSEPPVGLRSVTIRLPDKDIIIPLEHDSARSSDFLAGYRGPIATIAFHGGSLKVISALVYQAKVVIELLSRPLPDLPWISIDEEQLSKTVGKLGGGDELTASFRAHRRLFKLWTDARLTDSQQTSYVNNGAHGNTVPGGYKGEIEFSPGPSPGTTHLNLTLDQFSISIPLDDRQR